MMYPKQDNAFSCNTETPLLHSFRPPKKKKKKKSKITTVKQTNKQTNKKSSVKKKRKGSKKPKRQVKVCTVDETEPTPCIIHQYKCRFSSCTAIPHGLQCYIIISTMHSAPVLNHCLDWVLQTNNYQSSLTGISQQPGCV